MQPNLKKILRALSLEIRHTLEGSYDAAGVFHPGDLETRLNELGVWRERPARPLAELPHLSAEDRAARQVIDAYIAYRAEAGVERAEAVAEFVREAAYNWANRLLALRCMEARGIIDEVVLQKAVYGGRSMVHNRLAKKDPQSCAGPDEGLFAVLLMEFQSRTEELPELFAPNSPAIALRPSLPALKRVVGLLSGTLRTNGQEAATDEVFFAPDALGWAYQYWNSEEKDRVFEKVRTQKGAKFEGADIIPATQLYTDPYMVKFLIQNSLGPLWMGMHPDSKLAEVWEYFVRDADYAPVNCEPIQSITLLDPACGSGHFLLEAFDLLFQMYKEEEYSQSEVDIAVNILNYNLFGIDIDERAVQIAAAALWMKAKEIAPDIRPDALVGFHHHLVSTNIHLPKGKNHLKAFLSKHPESAPLQPALEAIFEGLENVNELGSLVQIEEPVEKELQYLRERYEGASKRGIQPNFFETTVVQGELPLGIESYEQWKNRTLTALEHHFNQEAETADKISAFFNRSASKGITLFDLLARRYSVVAANPPYMGSRQMGENVKGYIKDLYPETIRDICVTFVSRAISLLKPKGNAALVTQQSWLFSPSFSTFRHTDKRTGIFDKANINVVAHLGEHAFSDGAAGAVVAMFVIQNIYRESARTKAFLLTPFKDPTEKAKRLLKSILENDKYSYQISQKVLNKIPGTPLVYWIQEQFFDIFDLPTIESLSAPAQGLKTSNNDRFIRKGWETFSLDSLRWIPFMKGEGYRKWTSAEWSKIDWCDNGRKVKVFTTEILGGQNWSRNITNTDKYFKNSLVYTYVARGKLSLREIKARYVVDAGSPVIVVEDEALRKSLLGYLNSRVSTYLARLLSQNLFNMTGVRKIPVPITEIKSSRLQILAQTCVSLSNFVNKFDITQESYDPSCYTGETLKQLANNEIIYGLYCSQIRLTLEYEIDKEVQKLLNLSLSSIESIYDEVGKPVGSALRIAGLDNLLDNSMKMELGENLSIYISNGSTEQISIEEIAIIKKKLRNLFVEGRRSISQENEEIEGESSDDDAMIANSKIPAETFLEEISANSSIHPTSSYWIIRKGMEEEGWRCQSEEKRVVGNYFTVIILRLLGHRWPKQTEAGESIPNWADPDGIIPFTLGLKDLPLLERVRMVLPGLLHFGNVSTLEHEFVEIMSENLEKWLSNSFFKQHISQFKKRPIAWHITSQPLISKGSKGKSKKGMDKAPAFSCLLYYHKLNAGTLTTIKSQYVSPLRQSYETELRTLEAIVLLTPEQSSRRLQLEAWIDELKEFEERLERCAREGFSSPALAQVAAKESLDHWVSRDGQAEPPASRTEFEAQEMRYDPDLNDGVRVNIAPLQKFGLLAADVLDAKDIEKAIADRAEWRSDERRWCREGKLPKPGWWKD